MTAHLCSICQLPVVAAGESRLFRVHHILHLSHEPQQVGTDCCRQSLEHRKGRTPWQDAGNHRGLHKAQQCRVMMVAGLEQAGRMRSGETVLVTAAAGGTGQFAVQLAKMAGNQVVATCGSDDKAQLLTDLGCDRVINYNKEQPKVVHSKLNPSQNLRQSCVCACQDVAVLKTWCRSHSHVVLLIYAVQCCTLLWSHGRVLPHCKADCNCNIWF